MNKTTIFGLLLMATANIATGFCQKPTLFTNNYDPGTSIPKLDVEKIVIFDPVRTWTYSHHPSVAFFNNKFHVVFSNGPEGEDECGQRIMISESEDFTDWSEPKILLAPAKGEYGQTKILTPGGLSVIDGKLILYYTENDNDGVSNKRIKPTLFAITSSDGQTWSAPIALSIAVFPCQRPLTLSNGRIVLTGNTLVYNTNNTTGLSGWGRSRMDIPKYQDGAVTFKEINPSLCEGSLFEHNNGNVFCLLRSTGSTYDGYLWQMQSNDGGISWTSPIKSRFTDNNTKSFFGNLPDGRYFYVGTPDTTKPGERYPLVLAVSEDGFNFDKTYILSDDKYTLQYKGRWKGGDYGYPYAMVHDDYIYVIVSRRKERVEIIRIEIEALK